MLLQICKANKLQQNAALSPSTFWQKKGKNQVLVNTYMCSILKAFSFLQVFSKSE